MKQIKIVEPFKYIFRVLDRITMRMIGPFNSIDEAETMAYKEFGRYYNHNYQRFGTETYRLRIMEISTRVSGRYMFWRDKDATQPRLVMIRHEDEKIITPEEIDAARKPWVSKYARRDEAQKNDHNRDLDLIYRKHHPAKLKEDYCSKKWTYHYKWNDTVEVNWRRCKHMSHYHSITGGFATKKMDEAIRSFEEEDEEFNVKIKARRRFPMSLWSYERSSDVYGAAKSWKHHSKRRKQWIPK